jgi:Flp pilus assembly protein TadD
VNRRWLIVLAGALVLRLGHWWLARDLPFVSTLALDAQEYDRLARDLAGGNWWGGEDFYMAPLYIYVVALCYAWIAATPHAVYAMQIGVALVGVWAVGRLGTRVANERVGLVAAALFAGAWILVLYDVLLGKDGLAASCSALLLLAFDCARTSGSAWRWQIVCGVLAAALALLRENALLLLPLFALWSVSEWRRWRRLAAGVAAFGVGVCCVIGPVALRNAITIGAPLPSSYAGGTNLYVGNNPDADGMWRPIVPARQSPAIEQRVLTRIAEDGAGRDLSPAEVSGWWRQQVVDWAIAEPWAFIRLQVRKIALTLHPYELPDTFDPYWLRERSPFLQLAVVDRGALLVLAIWGSWLVWRERRWQPLVAWTPAWTLAIAVFFVFARYRLPMMPALCVLAAVPIERAWTAWRERGEQAGRTSLLGIVLIFAGFRAVPWPVQEGLVEYNLGRLAEEAGDLVDAERHYRSAHTVAPHDFVMAMNLGTVLARQGRVDEALPLLELAAQRAPRSVEAAANHASGLLAAGRAAEALSEAQRATALDPTYLPAHVTRALAGLRCGDHHAASEAVAAIRDIDPSLPVLSRIESRLAEAEAAVAPTPE